MKNQFEDNGFENLLEKLDSDINWNNKQKQQLKSRLLNNIEKSKQLNSNSKFVYPTDHNNKNRIGMKLLYSFGAFILLFGLFIGSAFISPAMAEIVSKIPYLNKVFQSESVHSLIWNQLENKGYKISGVGSMGGNITVRIEGSDQYLKDVREDIKKIVEDILISREYDSYTIKVQKEPENINPPISEREKALSKSIESISEILTNSKFEALSYSYSFPSPESKEVIIEIDVPNTEKRIEEIKKISTEILKTNKINSYSIKIKKIDLEKKEKEATWHPIFRAIFEGLAAKKEFQVTGFAYSFHPEPLEIIIKTSIKSSDKNAVDRAHKIEKTINEFLNSEEIKKKIDGQPYQIIIRSKEKKKLN